jgi:hypothetical protein
MSENQHIENEELNIEGCSREGLKRNPFQAPDGYFENLTPRVMEAVRTSEEKQAEFSFNWQQLLFPTIGIVAIAIVAVLIFNPNETDSLDFDAALATVTLEELDAFVEFETEELLAYELVDYGDFQSTLEEGDIIDYLIEQDLEIDELEELEI